MDLDLYLINEIVASKMCDKRDSFNLEIANFPFIDKNVPRSPSNDVNISELMRLARVCSNVVTSTKEFFFTSELLKQGFWYH